MNLLKNRGCKKIYKPLYKSGITIIFICIMIFGCSDNKKQISNEITNIEYEVISEIFDTLRIKNFNDSLFEWENPSIILDSTYFTEPQPWLIDKHRVKFPEEDYLIMNLPEQNKKKFKIDSTRIIIGNGLKIISINDIHFYLKRTNKIGLGVADYIFRISKPFVDVSNSKAIILIAGNSNDWKEEDFIWLRKEDGRWKIYDKLNTERH